MQPLLHEPLTHFVLLQYIKQLSYTYNSKNQIYSQANWFSICLTVLNAAYRNVTLHQLWTVIIQNFLSLDCIQFTLFQT